MRLKVSNERAIAMLKAIPHAHCQKALAAHWRVSEDGEVTAASVLWLFCWAKTGQGSEAARKVSLEAFDEILPTTFAELDLVMPHAWARTMRYRPDLPADELRRWLKS